MVLGFTFGDVFGVIYEVVLGVGSTLVDDVKIKYVWCDDVGTVADSGGGD